MTAPAKPAVVLIHGFLDDATVWSSVGEQLQNAGIEVYAPSYGRSGAASLAQFADEIVAALPDPVGPVILVGHSMGAPVAELAATRCGERVSGLVLVTPIPLGGLQLPSEVAFPLRECGENAALQRQLREQLSIAMPWAALERLVTTGVQIPARNVRAAFDAWTTGDRQAAAAPPPSVPSLIISSDDQFVDDALIAQVRNRFADADVARVAGAGHWPHIEKPAEVAELIERFHEIVARRGAAGTSSDSQTVWVDAFRDKNEDSFAAGFSPDVMLHASALLRPIQGRAQVATVMQAASEMYAALEFTDQCEGTGCRWLSWHAVTHSGLQLDGVTVLRFGEDGLIVSAAIHHRPLNALLAFSSELGDRLEGRIARDHFWSGSDR